ncbi:MAG TPA: CBS domain-containing protein [Pseudomonadales bacterium]|nr:CBS domain-containing protein [Pseudomonadales bacterium]
MSSARIPPLKAVMTPFPWAVAADAPLADARTLMQEHGVRHLPVVDDHRLVGVVTDRDLRRLLQSRLGLAAETELLVSDAMTIDVYHVDLDTPLDHALVVMARDHLGCTLVTREGRVAGILTSSDVCRLFAEHLGRLRPHGDEIA